MAGATNPRIINGMQNPRNWLNMALKVAKEPHWKKHTAADAAAYGDEDTEQQTRTPSFFVGGMCHGRIVRDEVNVQR